MDNASSFTIHQLGGFVSATNQLGKEHSTRGNAGDNTAGRPLQAREEAPALVTRKRKPQKEGQSSLTSLWEVKRQCTDNDRPRGRLLPSHSSSLVSRSASASLAGHTLSISNTTALMISDPPSELPTHTSTLHRAPLAGIPDNLAKHKLRPTMSPRPRPPVMETTEGDVPYAFLSSSPPLPKAAHKGQSMTAKSSSQGINENAEAVESLERNLSAKSDVRPAVTAHTTSLARLQATTTARKTLGVRRSMNGWNARCSQGGRGGQSFSVPSKKE
ncbi:MAG: hypothetical protein Q9204_008297 [Flavoplaca sp. TL-2023a]